MFNYTKAFPEYYNSISYRFTLIILATFVFISGYFIGKKNIAFKKQDIIAFYKKRLIRIYPLYLLAICMFTFFNLSDVVTSLKAGLIVSMLIKPAPFTLWFITMILIFYFLSPFLIHFSKIFNPIQLLGCYLVFFVVLLGYTYVTKKLDMRILMYFPSFALGIFVANKNKDFGGRPFNYFVIIVSFLGFLFSYSKTPYDQLNSLFMIPMTLSCSYLIVRVSKNLVFHSNKIHKIILILSYSSYCMYLFHRPIYISLKKLYFPESYFFQVVYLFFFCLPCIFCFSFIIQKIFDYIVYTVTNKSSERLNLGH